MIIQGWLLMQDKAFVGSGVRKRDLLVIRGRSPFDRTFLGGVDLCQLGRAIEEAFHIIHQKSLSIRIGKIKTVVIDDARLRL